LDVRVKLQTAAQQVVNTWGQRGFAASMRNLAVALDSDDQPKLLENVAAITAGICGHERWHRFYAGVSDAVGGFPGVWQLCVQAAREFTDEEASHDADSFEWIRAVELFAEAIVTSNPEVLTNPEASSFYLRSLARVSIGMSS
jgi:hypothetical protein